MTAAFAMLSMSGVGTLEEQIKVAYQTVRAMLDSGNFKAAAKFLEGLKVNVLKPVLEKILGASGNVTRSITLNQLTDIVRGGMRQIGQAALNAMKAVPGFKAGKWDPPGNQKGGFYIGNAIHASIAERYRRFNLGDSIQTNHISLGAILKDDFSLNSSKLSTAQRRLQPDILNVTKRHLYEIKSEKQIANAVIERDIYLEALNLAGAKIIGGPSTAPGANGVVEAPGGYALYYSPLPGVIVYRLGRGDFDPGKVPLPVAGQLPAKDDKRAPAGLPGRLAPAPVASASEPSSSIMAQLEQATGLTGLALLLYLIVSEGSRIAFPPRNLLPLP